MENVRSLTHEQVMEIIPHRDPMLLIDEASELVDGERIVATFYVDPAREIFQGHFPGDPVLPGGEGETGGGTGEPAGPEQPESPPSQDIPRPENGT